MKMTVNDLVEANIEYLVSKFKGGKMPCQLCFLQHECKDISIHPEDEDGYCMLSEDEHKSAYRKHYANLMQNRKDHIDGNRKGDA